MARQRAAMSDREELVLLLREVMRWEKRNRPFPEFAEDCDWNNLSDILNRAHVVISTDTRKRVRQRPQKAVLTAR